MCDITLRDVYRALVIAKLLYASPARWGYASASDKQRIESFIRRGVWLGFYVSGDPTAQQLIAEADERLFCGVRYIEHHVLQHLLPYVISHRYSLHPRRLNFVLTTDQRNFIVRQLFRDIHWHCLFLLYLFHIVISQFCSTEIKAIGWLIFFLTRLNSLITICYKAQFGVFGLRCDGKVDIRNPVMYTEPTSWHFFFALDLHLEGIIKDWFDKRFMSIKRCGSSTAVVYWYMFVNMFIVKLKLIDIGCHIGSVFVGCIMYADDIILLCPS